MKKFFNEFSKVILIVFLAVCVIVITCYEAQVFMSISLGTDEPKDALALMAFGTGLMALLGYGYKSFKQKDSLNRNNLKVDDKGNVTEIPNVPCEKKIGF